MANINKNIRVCHTKNPCASYCTQEFCSYSGFIVRGMQGY
jgi:hypothetical protein